MIPITHNDLSYFKRTGNYQKKFMWSQKIMLKLKTDTASTIEFLDSIHEIPDPITFK